MFFLAEGLQFYSKSGFRQKPLDGRGEFLRLVVMHHMAAVLEHHFAQVPEGGLARAQQLR